MIVKRSEPLAQDYVKVLFFVIPAKAGIVRLISTTASLSNFIPP
jgi:hypothetical protein